MEDTITWLLVTIGEEVGTKQHFRNQLMDNHAFSVLILVMIVWEEQTCTFIERYFTIGEGKGDEGYSGIRKTKVENLPKLLDSIIFVSVKQGLSGLFH